VKLSSPLHLWLTAREERERQIEEQRQTQTENKHCKTVDRGRPCCPMRNSQPCDLAACHTRPDLRCPVLVGGLRPHTSLSVSGYGVSTVGFGG